jgi:hypothetical protein
MLGKHSVFAYRQQTLITVAEGGETPSWIVLLLVDQPFSSSFQSGRKPHGWNTTRQVRSRGFSLLVPSSHPHSVCMMVRILLNSIVVEAPVLGLGRRREQQAISSLAIVQARQAAWQTVDHLLDSTKRENTIC